MSIQRFVRYLLLLLVVFSFVEITHAAFGKSVAMAGVLTSMPEGKWRDNGVAGRYNVLDLEYARNVSRQQKNKDDIDGLLGFCRQHFLYAVGAGVELFRDLQLDKKNIKNKCLAGLYNKNRKRLADRIAASNFRDTTEQDLDNFSFIVPFFFRWDSEYEKGFTVRNMSGIFSYTLSVEESLVILEACPSLPWYYLWNKNRHLEGYADCMAAALNTLLKRAGITVDAPNYQCGDYIFQAKLSVVKTYLDNIQQRIGLSFKEKAD